jgi:hypothetical protein
MNFREKLNSLFRVPPLTRARMLTALAIAAGADGLQLLLGPLGWAFADQMIDCAAMLLIMWLLGFHILLLPTFVAELVPLVDDLPTWTACTIAVIALRRRKQRGATPVVSPPKPD